MDGNRRWAISRGLPKLEGHRHGVEAFKRTVEALIARNIPVASFFAFSHENWRRTQEEVSWLMGLFRELFTRGAEWIEEQGVRLRISGCVADFPPDLAEIMQHTVTRTADNQRMTVNMALSYGGREEIVQAVRKIAIETSGDPKAIAAINEESINRHLYTSGLPDVDLLIRTAGEKRLSGFLPWQSVYAELYFTETLWPDFNAAELDLAFADFSKRKRNFGA